MISQLVDLLKPGECANYFSSYGLPVDVQDSSPRKLAAKAKEVREMFVETLSNWPDAERLGRAAWG